MKNIETIKYKSNILAIIIRSKAIGEMKDADKHIHFVTPDAFPFQIGMHRWDPENIINAHFHIPFKRLVDFPVQEYFYLISGKIVIDLYDNIKNKKKVRAITLQSGDSIVLNTGHGIKVLEPTEIIELKQGPYRGRELEKKYIK